jgi:hypothetical protein
MQPRSGMTEAFRDYRKTGIHSLVRFVRTLNLKQDLSAVEAAVSEPWSNGPVEGQLNRLKMLKRQMYGRPVSNYSALAYYPSPRLVGYNIAPKLRQNLLSTILVPSLLIN